MNISGYSIITKNDNPYVQNARVQSDGAARQRARGYADETQQQGQSSEPVQAETATAKARAVIPVSDVFSSQRHAAYYQTEDLSRFTSTQRKALQLYSANQGLSMMDANADYLGAVDTFA